MKKRILYNVRLDKYNRMICNIATQNLIRICSVGTRNLLKKG